MSTITQQKHASWGPLALRVVVGLIFVMQGYSKLQDISGFAGMLETSGYPIALVLAWLVALVELVAGAMLVLGIYTRNASVPLKIVIVFAIITKLLGGFGGAAWTNIQWDLLLLAALATLYSIGGGAWALISTVKRRPSVMKAKTTQVSKTPASKSDSKKSSTKKKASKSSTKKKTTKKKKKTSSSKKKSSKKSKK